MEQGDGRLPDAKQQPQPQGQGSGGDAEPAPRMCKKCDRPKAAFAHHCTVCGSCVAYMDHHCPFTHNCVGRHNFVHYYLFLLYTTAGACSACYLSLPAFLNCFIGPAHPWSVRLASALRYDAMGVALPPDISHQALWRHCDGVGDHSLTFIVVIMGLGCVGLLLTCHTAMIVLDITTIDALKLLKVHGPDMLCRPHRGWPAMVAAYRALPPMHKGSLMVLHDADGERRALYRFMLPNQI